MMDYGALSGMQASSTTGTSRKEDGLIREHAQNLFYFLQQVHVSKGSMKEESAMFSRPEYHVDIEFNNGTVYGVDINKGSLLVQVGMARFTTIRWLETTIWNCSAQSWNV